MPYQCNISHNLISYFDLARSVLIKKPYSLHQSALVGDQNGMRILGLYHFVSEKFDHNIATYISSQIILFYGTIFLRQNKKFSRKNACVRRTLECSVCPMDLTLSMARILHTNIFKLLSNVRIVCRSEKFPRPQNIALCDKSRC